jgi:WD40 repeat protein
MPDEQDKNIPLDQARENKYWVFISYSHADESWADWLHKALERYRIPRRLVGRQTAFGIIPKRLFPVFRDRDELPGAPSLPDKIEEALANSGSLVVICSPRSAVSQWVDKEITSYKQMGGAGRLFCLLVDGEPNASDHPEQGLLEAFPVALRYEVGKDGKRVRLDTEPIAVDVRKGKDTRTKAKIRLLAGILGLDFDELWRRDRRRKFWRRIQLATVGALVLLTLSAVWWDRQKALEEQTRITEHEQAVVRANALASSALSVRQQRGDMLELSVLLATEAMKRALFLDHFSPEINQILRDGLAMLPQRLGPALPHGPSYDTHPSFSPSGKWIAHFKGAKAWIRDFESGQVIAELQHAGDVKFAVFGPASRWFATAAANGRVYLWDTATWQSVNNLEHGAEVSRVVFAANGSRLASVGGQSIRLWETGSGKQEVNLRHDGGISAVAFGDTDDRLWSASQDGTARLWDLNSGEEVSRLKHASQWPGKMSFSPDARFLAVALDGVTVWNLESGKEVGQTQLPNQAYDVDVSLDGKVAVASGRSVLLWDVAAGRRLLLNHEDTVWDVEFSQDGRWLMSASPDRTARIWDTDSGRELSRMVHGDEVWKAVFNSTARTVATVSAPANTQASAVNLWRMWEDVTSLELRHAGSVMKVAINADRGLLSTISDDFQVQTWDTSSGEKVFEAGYGGSLDAAGLSPDGRLIAAGAGRNGPMRIYNPASKRMITELDEHGDWVTVMSFSPDGAQLATTSRYAPVKLWDTASARRIAEIETLGIQQVVYSDDGSRLVTVAGRPTFPTMTAQVWQAADGKKLLQIDFQGRLGVAALDPGGKYLFLCYNNAGSNAQGTTVRTWDLNLGQQVSEIVHENPVTALVVSPDGKWLAIGDTQGNVTIWDREREEEHLRIRLETEIAKAVFTRDAEWLAVAAGSTAGIWQVASGRQIARMPQGAGIRDIVFSADGRWLVSGSVDRVSRAWAWQPGDLIDRACRQLSRNLSRKEWREYLSGEEYEPTCARLHVEQGTTSY